MSSQDYYNRFDPAKKYTKTLFLAGRIMQSAEANEIQEYASYALKNIGDALFSDGNVVKGCTCVIDTLTGAVTVEAGKVYLNGAIRDVHQGNFTIPTVGSVKIGVYFKEKTITSLEDPELKDPAVGTRGFNEPGANRLQYQLTWGFVAEGVVGADDGLGEFFTIYNVEQGVLVQKALAPQMDSVSAALARYDNESNGSYLVRGMNVTCLGVTGNDQLFSVNEGKAHVNGYEIELAHSLRVRFDNEIDERRIDSDPYLFDGDFENKMTIHLNYTPLASVISVDATVQKVASITHGSYNGALDPIPSTSILDIIQVKQGGTIYVKNVDYKLTAGQVDWSLSGAEPSPGSSYECTYRHMTKLTPENVTDTGFVVRGAVDGTNVLVTYTWEMSRYDLITVDAEGIVRRIKGLAHEWAPVIPKAPTGQLVLAQIFQKWTTDEKPKVTNNAVRVVQMADIENLRSVVSDLFFWVSQLQLKNDANASDPSTKKGIFVDPFFDDDMRDQGIEQTGAIVNQCLVLPVRPEIHDIAKEQEVFMLPYVLEPIISQELQTGSMKVNPYMAFDPIPADVNITLNVDRWTDVETEWLSAITYKYYYYYYYYWRYYGSYSSTSSVSTVSSSQRSAEFMRQIQQNFQIKGMRPGERITKIEFDGVDITEGAI
jgi:hypothetical protein